MMEIVTLENSHFTVERAHFKIGQASVRYKEHPDSHNQQLKKMFWWILNHFYFHLKSKKWSV